MKIDRVVINASPLIILFKSQLAHLLPDLFEEILTPIAVWDKDALFSSQRNVIVR